MGSLPSEVIATDHKLSGRPRRPAPELPPVTDEEAAEIGRSFAAYQHREQEREARQIQARGALMAWAKAHAKRDEVVRAALDAGLSVHEIHRITGIARTTVTRIVTPTRQ
jgi:hypothetical protein